MYLYFYLQMTIFLIHFIYLFFIQEYAKGKRLACISLKAQTNKQTAIFLNVQQTTSLCHFLH